MRKVIILQYYRYLWCSPNQYDLMSAYTQKFTRCICGSAKVMSSRHYIEVNIIAIMREEALDIEYA